MKFSLASPTLVLALSTQLAFVTASHKLYRQEQHTREAHAAREKAAALAARGGFLNPMAEHINIRQASSAAPPAGSPPAASASASSASSAPAGSAPASGAAPASSAQSFSFSLASVNPTAVPLSSIRSAAPSASTVGIPSTPAAGGKPSNIANAPALPAPSLAIANYPALDAVPPVDSPEVLQWVKDVQASGVNIPNFSQTTGTGGCAQNPEALAQTDRCWWTCGGCVRDTDIHVCPDKNTWGLTYDDGPAPYTPDLLRYLDEEDIKATFFVVGSRVLSSPSVLQYEYLAGHQISIHTWSHRPLTTLTNEQIIAELGWSKKIIRDVLGVTPSTMRPPFGDIDDRVRAICKAMNLTPILWTRISPTLTLDTGDFDINGGLKTVDQVLFNWQNIISNVTTLNTGFIVLAHDLFQQAVQVSTGYILPDALARGTYKIEPITTCLKMDMGNSYIETNDNSSNPLPLAGLPGAAQGGAGGGNGASSSSVATVGAVLVGAAGLALGVLFA